jgi:uncharacterized protein
MDPIQIIEKYYNSQSKAYQILIEHGRKVADKALTIAKAHPEMNLDLRFIEEAAMLHDIGILFCHAPEIDCHGTHDYICHGYLGSELLQKEGYPRHALVCERHTGTGISIEMIDERSLPLPRRNYEPVTLEEQLICFADKFFSKTKLNKEKRIKKIQKSLTKHGETPVLQFNQWCELFF